jgi:TPP-dependent pyruvate/acetoin dehydrogenase alpha subunit
MVGLSFMHLSPKNESVPMCSSLSSQFKMNLRSKRIMAPKHQKRSRRPSEPKRPESSTKKLLSSGKLKQIYSSMLCCRMLEERARALHQEGKISRAHQLRTGSEAAEVGVILDLGARDCVSCGRRDAIVSLIRGVPVREVLARLLAVAGGSGRQQTSPAIENSGSVVAGQSTLAARINISTGVALAYKMQKKPGVVVVFSGNDATALNSWRESIDFAVSHRLPMVHVVQDDLGSESVTPATQVTATNTDTGPGAANGIPRLTVDGTDAVAVYRVAQEAIRRAREGHGPALIECTSHRWISHSDVGPTAAGNPGPGSSDPLSSMEVYLKQRGFWSDGWKARLVQRFSKELQTAISRATG